MVLRKSNSQWSVSPETIMSHHYKLTKGMRSRIDMGPPFSMYNSPKSIHYIPRRVASADAARRPLSRPHRELTDFIERTNPVDLKLPLNFRNSLYDFVKPKLLNDRNYQPPVHRKTQKPPLPPGTNQNLPKKKPSVPRRKTSEETLFKDAVYTNLIERGVYSDKFIIEITQIEMENWIGRLPWVNLEKLADEIYNELGVAMESQNKRSDLSTYLKTSLTLDKEDLEETQKDRRSSLQEKRSSGQSSVRSTGSSTPTSSSSTSESSTSESSTTTSSYKTAFLFLDYLAMAQHAAKNWYQVVKTAPKGRFKGIKRDYEVEDVLKLRGSIDIEYTLAIRGANKLWQLLHTEPFVPALGAQTGNQAVQMVRAGLKAIYLSGWQVAADANTASDMYPDQSLYPANSGPELCRRINKSLRRADQIDAVEAEDYQAQRDWYAPIVADAEAGFGGALNCFELMKAYIEGGAAGVHYEDQLGSEKKCGHMGGKVLIPTAQHIRHLNAARLAADVCNTPTIIVARTDAESSRLLTSDVDERDHPFIDRTAGRTIEGFYRLKESMALQNCVSRAIEYAPYCDLIWMETSHPTISDAKEFAEGVRKVYPDKLFAYNCSPSFNWKQHLSPTQMEKFQKELGAMGFKYQFITLAGFHANSFSMFDLARNYKQTGMLAYSELQQKEFSSEKYGYSAVKHQREVGTGYFDHVSNAITGGKGSTAALTGSTEEAQFQTGTLTASSEDEEIVQLTAPTRSGDEKILTPEALRFIKELNSEFNGRRLQLLHKRRQVQLDINQATWFPQFDKNTENIRSDEGWRGAEIPHDLQDRRVEITGPTDRKMIINALNSGANVFMADFEDSNSPTWRNQLEGQINLYDAVRDNISYVHPITKKEYTVSKDRAVLKVRPRGWHLSEKHVLVNNQPVSGSLFDFGMFAFHNAKKLVEKGSGPYFYLPKLQSAEEAKLWADVFDYTEKKLELPKGTIKCTVLVEHLLATFQTNEITYALKDYIVGLNCGRWDYIFSYIKVFQNHRKFMLPDRFQINMTSPFMRAYSQEVIKTCHLRGIHAMGGMSAYIPVKHDNVANEKAFAQVRQDKEREAIDGHDGTWVAHPGLVPIAKQVFNECMPKSNQIDKQLNINITDKDLTRVPEGTRTEAGFRHNINVGLGYLDNWLRGVGCVPLYNLMEDAATAEISRAQLWQWLKHEAKLEDGRTIDANMVKDTIAAEAERRLIRAGSVVNRIPEAAALLEKFATEDELSDFLTLDAYDRLVSEGH